MKSHNSMTRQLSNLSKSAVPPVEELIGRFFKRLTESFVNQIIEQPFTVTEQSVTVTEQSTKLIEHSVNHIIMDSDNPTTEQFVPRSTETFDNEITQQLESQITVQSNLESTTQIQDGQTNSSIFDFNYTTSSFVQFTDKNNSIAAVENKESLETWKIVCYVTVPLVAIVIVLVSVYLCYRKKHPVQLSTGNYFDKFIRVEFAQNKDSPERVNEEDEIHPPNNSSQEMNFKQLDSPKAMFNNLGLITSDGDEVDERNVVEAKRRHHKSKTAPGNLSSSQSFQNGQCYKNTRQEGNLQKRRKSNGRNVSKNNILVKQKHVDSNTKLPTTDNRINEFDSNSASEIQCKNGGELIIDTVTSWRNEDSIIISRYAVPHESVVMDTNSSFKNTSMKLFQQPSFEEIWNAVRARSMSLTLERAPSVRKLKRRSSIGPSDGRMSVREDKPLGEICESTLTFQTSMSIKSGHDQNTTTFNKTDVLITSQPYNSVSLHAGGNSYALVPKESTELCRSVISDELATDLTEINAASVCTSLNGGNKIRTDNDRILENESFQKQNNLKTESSMSDEGAYSNIHDGEITEASYHGSGKYSRSESDVSITSDSSSTDYSNLENERRNSSKRHSYIYKDEKCDKGVSDSFSRNIKLVTFSNSKDISSDKTPSPSISHNTSSEDMEDSPRLTADDILYLQQKVTSQETLSGSNSAKSNETSKHDTCQHNSASQIQPQVCDAGDTDDTDNDEEDTGLKLTDSDISNILDISCGDGENDDNMGEITTTNNLASSSISLSMTLQLENMADEHIDV